MRLTDRRLHSNWPHTFPAKFIADAYSRLPRERPPTTFEYERSFLSVLERLGFNPDQHARRNIANWSITDVTTWLSSQFPGALLLFEELHKLAGRFLGKLDGLSPADLNIRYHHLRIPSTILESYPANWLFALEEPFEPVTSVVDYMGSSHIKCVLSLSSFAAFSSLD